MPLEHGEWRETTPEDLKAFEDSLQGGLEEVPLTAELAKRLDRATQPTAGLDVLVKGNRVLYPQVERLMRTQGTVDIVVPVYNAWHVTRKCIDAVRGRTRWPYHLTIVDDASDATTSSALLTLAHGPLPLTLLRNARNRGFAATVNRGIRAGTGEYVCLLNSDVVVTPGWLTKMVMALHADERNAIVCPATNNTAVVDIPMSPGASYLQMAEAFESYALRRYPEILPTGFCFLFRRSLLEQVGYFDEAFKNFGEETDFWWKVVKLGGRAVMADDTYVFHERASSFSALGHDAHMGMRKLASGRFNQLHPEWTQWRDAYDVKAALGPLRVPVPPTLLRSPKDRYRVAWLVHDARACGAMRYIADLCNEMNERGANAKVVVLKREGTPEEWLGELRSAPVYFSSMDELLADFAHRVFPLGLVIAGTVELAPAVQALVDASGGSLRGCLHAQSFEPALALDPQDVTHLQALYKLLPDVISSSQWVADEIAALGPTPFAVVHPGVDRTLFYPRDRGAGDERPTVAIPMNPSVWWRGWDRGLELIGELERQADARGVELRILVYGVDSLPIQSRAICLGVLTQARLAHVLGTEVDALVDPSYVHSYGMPTLEAAATCVWSYAFSNRGSDETVVSGIGQDVPLMAGRVLGNIDIKWWPSETHLEEHNRAKSVSAWIEAVESHFKLRRKHRRICVVAPHLRKWGGPTTMLMIAHELAKRGHTVEVATVYEDVAPSIAAIAQVPIVKGQLPEAELYITNSDNPWVDRICTTKAKSIMLKLSHNPRFKREEERGLNMAWDAVVTSTQWLADAARTPMAGWDHMAHAEPHVIGWWHYEHARFRCPPSERVYGDGSAERPFVIGTLIHAHPTKGTAEALNLLAQLPSEYHYRFIGVGEVAPRAAPKGIEYLYEPTRDQLAAAMRQMDVWLSCSQSEGLGRMYLEAMSAGALVVAQACAINGPFTFVGAEAGAKDVMRCLFSPDRGKWAEDAFETAERAADPESCINALEEVIGGVFA